jgi:NitT/TauT family transport system ATP-binding protein
VGKVVINNINKYFPIEKGKSESVQVLKNINFSVKEQEVIAIIGGSGCGKTTLLRIISGLTNSTSGEILINDKKLSDSGHDVGMVFQQPGLMPWLKTVENVELSLELKSVPKEKRKELAMEYLRLVGLESAKSQYPNQLSGGMQQRVGLARALAVNPEILLMDEPFGALDAQTKETLQGEVLRIHEETKKTIIFVTHDLDEAVYLADRVIILAPHPGRIIEIVDVNIPRPRPIPAEARSLKEFIDKRYYVWKKLKESTPETA